MSIHKEYHGHYGARTQFFGKHESSRALMPQSTPHDLSHTCATVSRPPYLQPITPHGSDMHQQGINAAKESRSPCLALSYPRSDAGTFLCCLSSHHAFAWQHSTRQVPALICQTHT